MEMSKKLYTRGNCIFISCVCETDREKNSPGSRQGKALIEDNYVMCHVFAICEIWSQSRFVRQQERKAETFSRQRTMREDCQVAKKGV